MFGIHIIHNAKDAITKFGDKKVEQNEIRWWRKKSLNGSSSILEKNLTAAEVL